MAVANRRLNAAGSVVLNAAGTGTITLGPAQQRGASAGWHVTGMIAQTSRPGLAPIPKLQAYRSTPTPDNSLGLTYDGSFTTATADDTVVPGDSLVFVFTGGLAGDVAYVTLSGTLL